MRDLTYVQALEEYPEPHRPLLGPVPCRSCSAWLEWAGVEWLNAGTLGRHQCAVFEGQDVESEELVAEWTRPTTGLRVRQAHPASEDDWARLLGQGIVWTALVLVGLWLVVGLLPRLAAIASGGH